LALGTAVAVKPALAFYGLLFLRKRCWMTMGVALLTALVFTLVPFTLLRGAALGDWLSIARYYTGGDFPTYPVNQSARGLLLRAFAGGPMNAPLLRAPLLADALWITAALGALALWWRAVPSEPGAGRSVAPQYALTAAAMLFVAPLSEDIHYVALRFPLSLLADRSLWEPPSARWAVLAVASCLYFAQPWINHFYFYDNRGASDLVRLLASGAFLYGLLLVGGALLLLLRYEARGRIGERRSQLRTLS